MRTLFTEWRRHIWINLFICNETICYQVWTPNKSIYFVTVIYIMVPDTWNLWWVFTKMTPFCKNIDIKIWVTIKGWCDWWDRLGGGKLKTLCFLMFWEEPSPAVHRPKETKCLVAEAVSPVWGTVSPSVSSFPISISRGSLLPSQHVIVMETIQKGKRKYINTKRIFVQT